MFGKTSELTFRTDELETLDSSPQRLRAILRDFKGGGVLNCFSFLK